MQFFRSRKSTQERIKEATFKLLAEKGYTNLTMRDIAKKAGTAVGQLTYHYKKKETLIISVIEDVSNGCIEELKRRMKESKNKLRTIIDFFDDIYEKEPDMEKLLVDFMAESMWDESIKEKFKNFIEKVTELVEEVYLSYKYNKTDAKLKAKFFVASISGIMAQRLLMNSSDDAIRNYENILLVGEGEC